jgi:NAD-specific glutamate dehydrogenase
MEVNVTPAKAGVQSHERLDARLRGHDECIGESWIKKREHQAEQYAGMLADMRKTGSADLPMLIVAEQRLRLLYE